METEVLRACSKALATDSYPEPDEFSSRLPIMSVRTVLLLSENLLLGLPSVVLRSGVSRSKPPVQFSSLPVCPLIRPSNVLLFYTLIIFGGEYRSCRCSLYSFLQPPVISY